MKYLFPIFFLTAICSLKSQTIWIKGYGGLGRVAQLGLTKSLIPESISFNYRTNAYGFFMPAVVIENRRNSNFWEVGFYWAKGSADNDFSILKAPPSDSIQLVDLGEHKFKTRDLHLDYNFKMGNGWGKHCKIFLGFALNPYWSKFSFKPHQTYLFPMDASEIGVKLGIVPRIQYRLAKNLILDFNGVLSVFSADYQSSKEENPVLTPNQQSNSLIAVDFLDKYALRIGLAYRIWHPPVIENLSW